MSSSNHGKDLGNRADAVAARRLTNVLLVLCALTGWALLKPPMILAQTPIFTPEPIWNAEVTFMRSHRSACGDVDLDGDLDLIAGSTYLVANELTASVFPSDPSGFAIWESPDGTRDVAFGDIDGDGFLDLLVATDSRNQLLLQIGGQGNQFSLTWTANPTDDTRCLAVGDLNADGDLDLVCGNFGTDIESSRNVMYLNLGTGLYYSSAPDWYSRPEDQTAEVVLGDVDGDGDLDLLCGNGIFAPKRDTLYKNRYDENVPSVFSPDQPDWLYTESITHGLALGDVDGDGDLDLVRAGDDGCVYLNRYGESASWEDQVFDENPIWQSNAVKFAVALGDIDADGDLDMVTSGATPNILSVYLNTGADTIFDTIPSWQYTLDELFAYIDIVLADVDNDGDLDLIATMYLPARRVLLFRNLTSVVNEEPVEPMITAEATWSAAVGDVDGDLAPDLVFGNDGTSRLFINLPAEPDRFGPTWQWSSQIQTTRAVGLADIDADGDLDLLCGNYQQANSLYENIGGVFALNTEWNSVFQSATTSVASGDIDLDGDPDVIFGNDGAANHVYENIDGALAYSGLWSPNEVRATRDIALADIDGDGNLDLVAGNYGDRSAVYRNEGSAFTSGPIWESNAAYATGCIALGDVDGDGDMDLACGNEGQPNCLFLNVDGALSPVPNWNSQDSADTRSITFVDLDGDGDLDLVCGNYNAQNVLYLNIDGELQQGPLVISIPSHLTNVVRARDFDDDGDLDLICGNEGQQNSLYWGRRNPVYSGDPAAPTQHLPNNPTYVTDVVVEQPVDNLYHIGFTAIDIEADPFWLLVRYRYDDESTWRDIDGGGPVGQLMSSPTGVAGVFDWDVTLLDIDPRRVTVELRPISVPNTVSVMNRITAFHKDIGPLMIRRAQIAVWPDTLSFARVTLGDTVSSHLYMINTGTAALVTQLALPTGMLPPAGEYVVAAGDTTSVEIFLAPEEPAEIGGVVISSNDPFTPSLSVPVVWNIDALTADVLPLIEGTAAPLGEALTMQVIPHDFVNIERCALHYAPDDDGSTFTSSEMTRHGQTFISVIPGEDITEVGLRYYVELENSPVVVTYPENAPDSTYTIAVEAPVAVVASPIPNSETGFLEGRPVRIEVALAQGTIFQHGTVHYRAGGDEAYTQLALTEEDLVLVATIPATATGPRGLEYWAGVRTASDSLTTPSTDPAGHPYVLPISVPDYQESDSRPALQYRMVSIPLRFSEDFGGTLEALLADQPEFGPYDPAYPAQWLCYRWLTAEESYVQLSNEEHFTDFRPMPGRGFWLVCREENRITTAPILGYSTATDSAATITLEPGYNQIGSPFAFNVSWDSVLVGGLPMAEAVADGTIDVLYAWTGTDYTAVDVIEPFAGYFVKNLANEATVLQIPPLVATTEAVPQDATASVCGRWEDGWCLQIRASSCGVTDDSNFIGVTADANVQWDRHDRSKAPPNPSRSLSLYFPHLEWPRLAARYATDIRDAGGSLHSGHRWCFDVAKSFTDEGIGDQVVVEIGELESIPQDLQILLRDRELLQTVDLRAQGSYRYFLGRRDFVSSDSDARFELIVGDADYIAEQTGDLPAHPLATLLYQNRPNPFNPSTVIRYDIAAAGQVDVRIYDISGALITTLVSEYCPAGRYETAWRGDDHHGQRLASGVYFVQLVTSTGYRETRKALLMR